MASNTTTIRIQFSTADGTEASAESHLSGEIDSRPAGLNGGKTSFGPGETAYLLLYKSSNMAISQVITSAGSIAPASPATTTVEITEELIFEDSATASVPVPISGAVKSVNWMGRSLGGLSISGTTATAGQKGVAVASVTYEALAYVYALQSPATINGLNTFSILVLVQGIAS